MTEIEAKVSYVKLARSLKTYGVSFFLVKVTNSLDICALIEINGTALSCLLVLMAKFVPITGKNERKE